MSRFEEKTAGSADDTSVFRADQLLQITLTIAYDNLIFKFKSM